MPIASTIAGAALLPERRSLFGPVTRRRLIRLLLIYAAILAAGLLLVHGSGSQQGQAFGLGLMLPGGGFFAQAGLGTAHGLVHLGIGLLAIGIFIFGLTIWFATGNAIAPPAIWLLFAVFGALMDHGPIPHHAAVAVECGVAALAVAAVALALARQVHYAARRREANVYLQHAALGPEPAIADQSHELRADDVKLMRFLLDRALQPVEAFAGFEWLDQFQTAAVRYQVNFVG